MNKKEKIYVNPNNPLINSELKIIVNDITDKEQFENKFGIILHKKYSAERAKITKLYTSAKNRKAIASSTTMAKNILFWIMFVIDYGEDYFYFDRKQFMYENKVKSPKTVNNALKELEQNKLLAPTNIKDVYFINPAIFYSGSRIKSFPDNIQVYKPTTKEKQ